MATCLGIYVDKNIIKYAKVSKEKEDVKVDAFGIKVYSDLEQAINQIVSETFSFKIPISVNMSDENYNYFSMSDLLNPKDLGKAINTEFESICYEKQINQNALEARYALVNDVNEKGKIKVIHVSTNKTKINKILQDFDEKNVSYITPMPISIANIAPLNPKENTMIVNIEDVTNVTIIVGQKVYDIQKIPVGAGKILDAINEKENSYAKAYEICKNTTIYTMEGKDLQEKENEYLQDIVPTLYEIATQLKEIINANLFKINQIYITGTASAINNIDLYFEEIIGGIKCKILKPVFITDSSKINMRDYIEVNSALALALQGLGYGIKTINFHKKSFLENLPNLLKANKKMGGSKREKSGITSKFNIKIPMSKIKKWTTRVFSGVLILTIAYIGISVFMNTQFNKKKTEIEETQKNIDTQISAINNDIKKVNAKVSEYNTLTEDLKNAQNEYENKLNYKNAISNLLSEVMNVIPKQVQLLSIENTSSKNIVIKAQSTKYEQLAYFKALLKTKNVLNNVASTEAVKEGDIVKIVIEGVMP